MGMNNVVIICDNYRYVFWLYDQVVDLLRFNPTGKLNFIDHAYIDKFHNRIDLLLEDEFDIRIYFRSVSDENRLCGMSYTRILGKEVEEWLIDSDWFGVLFERVIKTIKERGNNYQCSVFM